MNNLNYEKKYPDGYPPTYVHDVQNLPPQQYTINTPNISTIPPPNYPVYTSPNQNQNQNQNIKIHTPNQNIPILPPYTSTNPIAQPHNIPPYIINSNHSLYTSTNPITYSSNSPIYTINNSLPNTYVPYMTPQTQMVYQMAPPISSQMTYTNHYYVPTTTTTIYQVPIHPLQNNIPTTISHVPFLNTVVPMYTLTLSDSLNSQNIKENITTTTTTTTTYNYE